MPSCTTSRLPRYEYNLDTLFRRTRTSGPAAARHCLNTAGLQPAYVEVGESHERKHPDLAKVKKSVALSGTPAATPRCARSNAAARLPTVATTPRLTTKSTFAKSRTCLCMVRCLPCRSQGLQDQAQAPARVRHRPRRTRAGARMHTDGLAAPVCSCWVRCLPSARPMRHPRPEHRRRLMASFGSMLLYWWHFTRNGRASTAGPTRLDRRAFLHLFTVMFERAAADALDKSWCCPRARLTRSPSPQRVSPAPSRTFIHASPARSSRSRPKAGGAMKCEDHHPLRYRRLGRADIRARMGAGIVIGFGIRSTRRRSGNDHQELSRKLCKTAVTRCCSTCPSGIENLMIVPRRCSRTGWYSQRVPLMGSRPMFTPLFGISRSSGGAPRDRAARGRQYHPPERELLGRKSRVLAIRSADASSSPAQGDASNLRGLSFCPAGRYGAVVAPW